MTGKLKRNKRNFVGVGRVEAKVGANKLELLPKEFSTIIYVVGFLSASQGLVLQRISRGCIRGGAARQLHRQNLLMTDSSAAPNLGLGVGTRQLEEVIEGEVIFIGRDIDKSRKENGEKYGTIPVEEVTKKDVEIGKSLGLFFWGGEEFARKALEVFAKKKREEISKKGALGGGKWDEEVVGLEKEFEGED